MLRSCFAEIVLTTFKVLVAGLVAVILNLILPFEPTTVPDDDVVEDPESVEEEDVHADVKEGVK